MHFHGGLSPAEISRELGVSAGAVRRRLRVGLEHLRERMDRRMGGRAAWIGPLLGFRGPTSSLIAKAPIYLFAMKKAALASALALFAVLAVSRIRTASDPGELTHGTGISIGGQASEDVPRTTEPGGPAVGTTRVSAAGDTPRDARLEFVDSSGQALTVTRAVALSELRTEEVDLESIGGPRVGQLGPVTLVVASEETWLWRTELDLKPGVNRVVAPAGATLSGRVSVKGAVPEQPLEFALVRDVPRDGFFDLTLDGWDAEAFTRTVQTDRQGTFRVQGLPENWRGVLRTPVGYWFAGGEERSWDVSLAGQESVELDLELRPWFELKAQFVDGATGEPATDVSGMVRLLVEPGNHTDVGWSADDDGQLSLQHETPQAHQVLLSWVGGEWSLPEPIELELPFGADSVDLGRIPLRRLVPIKVRALDAAGDPVADASVRASGHGISPTGQPGEFRVHVEEAAKELNLSVWSPRHRKFSGPVKVIGGLASVFLEVGSGIELRVRDSAGVPLAHQPVWFALEPTINSSQAVFALEQGWSMNRAEGVVHTGSSSSEDGLVRLSGLEVGARGTFGLGNNSVADQGGTPFGPLPGGSVTVLEVGLPDNSVRVRGVVRDPRGRPIEGAKITIERASGRRGTLGMRTSQTDGRFAFWVRLIDEPMVMEVVADQFAERRLELASPIDLEAPLDIELIQGRSFRVRIEDELGRPQIAESILYRELRDEAVDSREDLRWLGSSISQGTIRNFEASSVEIVALLSGVEHRWTRNTNQGDFLLRVPSSGSLNVSWDPIDEDLRWVNLRVSDPTNPEVHLSERMGPASTTRIHFPTVHPGSWEVILTRKAGLEADSSPLAGPQRVEVFAGAKASVHLSVQ